MDFEIKLEEKLLCAVYNQMHSLLLGDPADECQDGDVIFELGAAEVLFLQQLLGLYVVAGGLALDEAHSFILPDAVGEGKGVGILPKHSRKGRLLQQIEFV